MSLATSTTGTINADKASRSIQSFGDIAYVRNTGRSAGTKIATRWMAALAPTAARSGKLMSGFDEKTEKTGLLQLHAWNKGERAKSEKASARVFRSDSSSCGDIA